MNAIEKGSGPPILFLPGWLTTRRWWDFQIAWAATTRRVHALDYPAVDLAGRFDPAEHSVDAYAERLHALLRRLPEPAVAVGWSLGAGILLRAIERFGDSSLAGLVLVDQTPRSLAGPGWTLGVPGLDGVFRTEALAGIARDLPAAAAQAVRACFAVPPARAELEALTRQALRWHPEAAAALLADHWSRDYRTAAARVNVPTLLVTGGRSAFTPPGAMRWLNDAIAGSQLQIFAEAGHAPFLEAPDRFRRLLEDFMEEEAGGDGGIRTLGRSNPPTAV